MSSSRGSGRSVIPAAIASRSSVVWPIALTTTITPLPASRARTTRSATASRRSTEPTDVPPNFMTTVGMPEGLLVGPMGGDAPSVVAGTLQPGMQVSIHELPPERWPEAGRLAGRAFWTEDYMAPLAEDLIERFAIVQDLYLRMESSPSSTTLAAFGGDHVVGFACIERGACYFCEMDPSAAPPSDDRTAEVMHGVDLTIRALHVGLPPHANIGPVAVEPTLQGKGIGAALVDAAYALAASDAPPTVSLDCDPRLQGFYEARGFQAVARATDPWGYGVVGLRGDPARPVP